MTVTTVKAIAETMEVDSHGPTITTTFACAFTGTYDDVYIYQNAAAIGIPQVGDYVTGTSPGCIAGLLGSIGCLRTRTNFQQRTAWEAGLR